MKSLIAYNGKEYVKFIQGPDLRLSYFDFFCGNLPKLGYLQFFSDYESICQLMRNPPLFDEIDEIVID